MKSLSLLLTCLLAMPITMLSAAHAWGSIQVKERQAKPAAKVLLKKAKVAAAKTKQSTKAVHAMALKRTAGKAPMGVAKATQSSANAPVHLAALAPNPYLHGTPVVKEQGGRNSYAVEAAITEPLTLTQSMQLASLASTAAAFSQAVETVPGNAQSTPAIVPVSIAPGMPIKSVQSIEPQMLPAELTAAPNSVDSVAVSTRTTINPYLANSVALNQVSSLDSAGPDLSQVLGDIRSILPSLPPPDQAILPTVKKVYPTGEKPLYVLTFKCPTELIGITPIPTKALHWLVSSGMDAINSTDLLPFNMQQVCQ